MRYYFFYSPVIVLDQTTMELIANNSKFGEFKSSSSNVVFCGKFQYLSIDSPSVPE